MLEFWNNGIPGSEIVTWRDLRIRPNIIEVDLDPLQ